MAYAILDIMGIWDGHDWTDYRTWAVISGQEQPIFKQYWYTSMEGRLHIFGQWHNLRYLTPLC